MTVGLILLALVIANTLFWTRKARRRPQGRDCAPLTRHEREDAWRERFMPLADDYLATAFRGAAAKRRLVQECRNRQGRVLADIAARAVAQPTVRAMESYGLAERVRCHVAAPELRSLMPAAPAVQITVKRPRLSLAR
jgi:hypothetical protein